MSQQKISFDESKDDITTQRSLTIEAERTEGHPMFLRQSVATAEGDGFEVEIAISLLGAAAVVVTHRRKDRDTWVSYVLQPRSIVEAVLALEASPKDEAP